MSVFRVTSPQILVNKSYTFETVQDTDSSNARLIDAIISDWSDLGDHFS